MSDFVNALLEELKDLRESDLSFDPYDFPVNTCVEDIQSIEVVCSTFKSNLMTHIYKANDGDLPDRFLYSSHGDGGVVISYGGPFNSLSAAKRKIGRVPEGWTTY